MPYWVEQTKGPARRTIDKVLRAYRAEKMSLEQAWEHLSVVYEVVRKRDAPSLEEHKEGDAAHVMVCVWFPMYANMWFEGTETACEKWVKRWNKPPNEEYQVCYEY